MTAITEFRVHLSSLHFDSQPPEAWQRAATRTKNTIQIQIKYTQPRTKSSLCWLKVIPCIPASPECCAPGVHPHGPTLLLCSQRPPAELPHLTRYPGRLGSEPSASHFQSLSDSKEKGSHLFFLLVISLKNSV